MRLSAEPLYRRVFLDHDASMILPLVPATWVFFGGAIALEGRWPFALGAVVAAVSGGAAPGDAPIDPVGALIVTAVVALVYPGGAALLLWYLLDGVTSLASIEDGQLIRTRSGLFRRTDAIALRDVARAWAFEDTRTRGRPFRIELGLTSGRRVRWLTVNRRRQGRLAPLVEALRRHVPVDGEVPPKP